MINQAYILLSFFATGVCIGVLFDIFRITRLIFKTPNMLIYIEDILFWLLAGILVLFTIYTCTDGQVRLYMILMLILGSFMYFLMVSKHIIIIIRKVVNIIKHSIKIKCNIKYKKISKNSGK